MTAELQVMKTMLVAYDIPDDRRRQRLARELSCLGRRVQYSVFLVHNKRIAEVVRRVVPLLSPAEDNVRVHPLCAACEAKAVLLGRAGGGAGMVGFRVI